MPAAQFLLSMIAPAAPAAPQGSSAGAGAAADFQGLLAGLMGAVTANDGEPAEPVSPRTPRSARTADVEIQPEAPDATASGFLTTPVPAPLVQPASPDGEVPSAADGGKGDALVQPPAPETLPPLTRADQSAVIQPPAGATGEAAAEPQVQSLFEGDAKNGAQTQPMADAASDPPAAGAEAAARAVAEVAAGISRPDASRASPLATPAEPAPLRLLAERTSRPLDSAGRAAAAGEGASSGPAPDVPAAASVEAAAPPAEARPRPVEAPAAATQVAADTSSEDAPAESAPGPDAPAQTSHPAAARDAAPVMSRAAIDATAQIAAQILKRLDGRSTRFEMSLTPDELGRVDIKLDIDSEGRLAARLAFDNPAAAADLKGRADELRRQLEQQGFHLAEDAFEFAERDSGSSAFDRGQDARHGQTRFSAAARVNSQADAIAAPRWTAHSLSPSGVDLKV